MVQACRSQVSGSGAGGQARGLRLGMRKHAQSDRHGPWVQMWARKLLAILTEAARGTNAFQLMAAVLLPLMRITCHQVSSLLGGQRGGTWMMMPRGMMILMITVLLAPSLVSFLYASG